MKNLIKYIILIIFGLVLGILANRNKHSLINAQFIRDHWHFRKAIENKVEVAKSKDIIVFLAFGQSNAGNFGEDVEYVSRNEVYNFYKGNLYKAKEPLLGPDGGGNSVWTRLGDMLIDSGICKKVIIVPCAIGGTSVDCWANGPCKEKLIETLDYLKASQINLTHIFWSQGESDNVDKTSKLEYITKLKKVIKILRDRDINSPFFTSITSYFPYNNDNLFGIDKDIRDAQNQLIDEGLTKRGPDTDSLNLAYYRKDAVHFTAKGLDKLALEWFKKIKLESLNK